MLKIEMKASELQEVCACWWSLRGNPSRNTNKGRRKIETKHQNFKMRVLVGGAYAQIHRTTPTRAESSDCRGQDFEVI
jgi:hypothetical protein